MGREEEVEGGTTYGTADCAEDDCVCVFGCFYCGVCERFAACIDGSLDSL